MAEGGNEDPQPEAREPVDTAGGGAGPLATSVAALPTSDTAADATGSAAAVLHKFEDQPKTYRPAPREPGFWRMVRELRQEPPRRLALLAGVAAVVLVIAAWALLTAGVGAEDRFISPVILPSPLEVAESWHELWFDRALTRSVAGSLTRVGAGFLLAALVGVPFGILCGSFPIVAAFFQPLTLFGRNVPIAALIPLTILWFGTGETQKVMFIFVATVAFVLFDATRAVSDVESRYLDTAYTLGATRWQTVRKILVPLALPDIFNSLRLLFGLAFGYVMLAELIDAKFGLGYIIQVSQRRGPREHIILVLFVITLVAYGIDRLLFTCQRRLFAYRYER